MDDVRKIENETQKKLSDVINLYLFKNNQSIFFI